MALLSISISNRELESVPVRGRLFQGMRELRTSKIIYSKTSTELVYPRGPEVLVAAEGLGRQSICFTDICRHSTHPNQGLMIVGIPAKERSDIKYMHNQGKLLQRTSKTGAGSTCSSVMHRSIDLREQPIEFMLLDTMYRLRLEIRLEPIMRDFVELLPRNSSALSFSL